MKLICIFMFSLISSGVFGQLSGPYNKSPSSAKYVFTDSLKANQVEIHTRAREWITSAWKSYTDDVSFESPEKLVLNGTWTDTLSTSKTQYTLTIDVQNDKYKLTINNFVKVYMSGVRQPLEEVFEEYKQADKTLDSISKTDQSILSKKEIDVLNSQISNLTQERKERKRYFLSQVGLIKTLTESFSDSMKK